MLRVKLQQFKKRFAREVEGPVCDSGIFCHGALLDTVQMAGLYPDSKTFVDKKLKHSPGKIIKRFEELLKANNGSTLSREQIKEFVDANFDDEGLELELWTPEDWTPEPAFIMKLQNKQLRGLAKRINRLWKDLSRKIKDDVKENPQLYSIIYVPNAFVVPGGRFREFYYWDTYWIIKALLQCDMATTVKGIIENFFLMVNTYGLVPNGGRVYYIKRSQPPFLALMMREYMSKTAEIEFLRKNIATLEREMEFWENRRSLLVEDRNGVEHTLFVYGTGGTGPRPESYREDVELAEEHFQSEDEKEEFYFHMKAGAESGWDYSTRWMIDSKGKNKGELGDVKTNYIIPVDLNSVMYMNFMSLAEFHSLLGDAQRSEHFLNKAEQLQKAIQEVLWNKEDKMWYDYDFLNNTPRKYFYPSNLFPLWAECYDTADRMLVAESSVQYLRKTGAIYCRGGVPTSLDRSGQQWDFPNAWPPLQHILVAGLLKTEHSEAYKMALTIARRYTVGTMFSCSEEDGVCQMFEKYDVTKTGSAGGGGEYDVQTGFGWSNGVVIEFIALFGDALMTEDDDAATEYDAAKFREEIVLNTHFHSRHGKSILVRRESNIFEPEKHEYETSEKVPSHPALAIEEDGEEFDSDDDEGDEDGGLILEAAAEVPAVLRVDGAASCSSSSASTASSDGEAKVPYGPESLPPVPNRTKNLISFFEKTWSSPLLPPVHPLSPRILDLSGQAASDAVTPSDLSELLDASDADFIDDGAVSEDGEEIKAIAGRSLRLTPPRSCGSGSSGHSEDLIMHLVNVNSENKGSRRRQSREEDKVSDTISIKISNKDVNVISEDGTPVEDVDLELEIPREKLQKNNTLKRRVLSLVRKITLQEQDKEEQVVIIKDKVKVKNALNGKVYDLDLDLKVEMAEPLPDNTGNKKKNRSESKENKSKEKDGEKAEAPTLTEAIELTESHSKSTPMSQGNQSTSNGASAAHSRHKQHTKSYFGSKLSLKKRSQSLRRLMCPINAPWSRSKRNLAAALSPSSSEASSIHGGDAVDAAGVVKSTTLPSAFTSANGSHAAVSTLPVRDDSPTYSKVRSLTDLTSAGVNNNDKFMSLDPLAVNSGAPTVRRSTADIFRYTMV